MSKKKYSEICMLPECSRKTVSRGLCSSHWSFARSHGLQRITMSRKGQKCSECSKPVYARGFCHNHHQTFLRHGKPFNPNGFHKKRILPLLPCSVPGCERVTRKKSGLCDLHYNRRLRLGSEHAPISVPFAQGKKGEQDVAEILLSHG